MSLTASSGCRNIRQLLSQEFSRLEESLDHQPSYRDMEKEGKFNPDDYEDVFESWSEAVLSLSEPEKINDNKISRGLLLTELHRVYLLFDKVPTMEEFNNQSKYSAKTYSTRFGSWNQALVEAGIRANRKDLLFHLQELRERLGKVPSVDDMDEKGDYSTDRYVSEFGTWNDSLRLAGLDINERRDIPPEELLEELERLSNELGESPSYNDMDEKGKFSPGAYIREFGRWNTALREAGLSITESNSQRRVSKSEALSEIERVSTEVGEPIHRYELKQHSSYSLNVYERIFGNWESGVKEAGFKPGVYEPSKSELKEELRRLDEKLNHTPRRSDMKNKGQFSPNIYRSHFGSWNLALQSIDVTPDPVQRVDVSKNEILNELKRVAGRLFRSTLTLDHIRMFSSYSTELIYRKFGSWIEALRQARLSIFKNQQTNISREKKLDELHRVKEEIGKIPTCDEMDEYGKYSASAYFDEFETWRNALLEAGFDLSSRKTSIENEMNNILQDMDIKFSEQVEMDDYILDIFIESQSICIEVDGDFWHGHPKYSDDYYEVQREHIQRDEEKDKLCQTNGIHVIRIWGETIRNIPKEKIKQQLRSEINSQENHGEHLFGPEPK